MWVHPWNVVGSIPCTNAGGAPSHVTVLPSPVSTISRCGMAWTETVSPPADASR